MTDKKCAQVVAFYEKCMNDADVAPVKDGNFIEHVAWMLSAMPSLEDQREKWMRWLGYVQGVLSAFGVFEVEDLKEHSRPETEDKVLVASPEVIETLHDLSGW